MTTPEPAPTEDLAQLIDRIMATTGDSQSDIARRISVSPATVNAWLRRRRGQGRGPARTNLERLAAEYKIPEEQVFAAAGRTRPGPLPPDRKAQIMKTLEQLTAEQQQLVQVQIEALAERNRTGA